MQPVDVLNERLDRVALGSMEVSDLAGGVIYDNLADLISLGKMMAATDIGVPKHLRGKDGACVRICIQALEWRMSPFAVADKSYFVNDRIAYESQLIHAVIEARAPLKQRLRATYEGEGSERVCIVTGWLKDESEPLVYRSPPFSQINPKNSPLWKSDPDQQQWYYSSRAWCRRYCPDVLLGIYSRDELEDDGKNTGPDKAKDVTPKKSALAKSLAAPKEEAMPMRGFSADHVEKQTAKPVIEPEPEAVAIEVDRRPEAFALGESARREGRPICDIPAGFADKPLFEAFQDGWKMMDSALTNAEIMAAG